MSIEQILSDIREVQERIESKVDALTSKPKPDTIGCGEAIAILGTTNWYFNKNYRKHKLTPVDAAGKRFLRADVERLKKEIKG